MRAASVILLSVHSVFGQLSQLNQANQDFLQLSKFTVYSQERKDENISERPKVIDKF